GIFGDTGKVLTAFDGPYQSFAARAVLLQPDGKIVVAGDALLYEALTPSTSVLTDAAFALARYDSRGNLDPDFGSGGKKTVDINVLGRDLLAVDILFGIAFGPGGTIITVGDA